MKKNIFSENKPLSIEKALETEEKCLFPIKGISMLPMLEQKRDTVVLSSIKEKPKKYDVVLYKVGNSYVLHRIIGVKNGYYIICGDNCIKKEIIQSDKIIAKAIGFYKNGKYIPCNDEKYLKYAKKQVSGRWKRIIAFRVKNKFSTFLGFEKEDVKKKYR